MVKLGKKLNRGIKSINKIKTMQNTVELEEEYSESPEEKYQSLLKSIAWTPGFRLLFVSSSPAKREEIIERGKKIYRKKA